MEERKMKKKKKMKKRTDEPWDEGRRIKEKKWI